MKWFSDLVKNNNGHSSKSWFLVVLTLVGIFILAVLGTAILIEAIYNHTVTTDLMGISACIGAVSTMFATAGVVKVMGEKNEIKSPIFDNNPIEKEPESEGEY